MFVVILLEGDDLPEVFGPFSTGVEAVAFTRTIPAEWEPVVVKVEPPVWRVVK